MSDDTKKSDPATPKDGQADKPPVPKAPAGRPAEVGGPAGPEPTRYGDWERGGRCVDF